MKGNQHFKGKKHSPETIKIMSEKAKLREALKKQKK